MKKKSILTIFIILLFIICISCISGLFWFFFDVYKAESNVSDLESRIIYDNDTTEKSNVAIDLKEPSDKITYVTVNGKQISSKFEDLYRDNTDFIGWIQIYNTDISYPVMQNTEEPYYYLNRDYYKSYSSSGSLFIDADCEVQKPSDNLIIYGHNMQSGNMFHDLLNYDSEAYFKEHKYIRFDTIYNNGMYEIIAAFRTKVYSGNESAFRYYSFYNANNKEEFNYFIDNIKALTPYDTGVNTEYGDKFITLSTCAYHAKDGRFVVVAKKIK